MKSLIEATTEMVKKFFVVFLFSMTILPSEAQTDLKYFTMTPSPSSWLFQYNYDNTPNLPFNHRIGVGQDAFFPSGTFHIKNNPAFSFLGQPILKLELDKV